MKAVVLASVRASAGKTSLALGIALSRPAGSIGFMKPLGDRMRYRSKRAWDYDAALIAEACGLPDAPEELSLGFDQSKLRYVYPGDDAKKRVREMAAAKERNYDVVLVEAGATLSYGSGVQLDALSLASVCGAPLVLVCAGNEEEVYDDVAFVSRRISAERTFLRGVVVTKVADPLEFRATHAEPLAAYGVPLLGIVPLREELTWISPEYLADYLFARVVAGEAGLRRVIKRVFVGVMSVDAALRLPEFQLKDKLIITSGDRSDMIVAALETDAACIALSNDIMPTPTILARADALGVPVLLAAADTYRVAKQVDDLEPLTTAGDAARLVLLRELITANVDLEAILAT